MDSLSNLVTVDQAKIYVVTELEVQGCIRPVRKCVSEDKITITPLALTSLLHLRSQRHLWSRRQHSTLS